MIQKKYIYWSQLFFFGAVIFKQFYFFPSGGMQIGDVLFVLSFCLLFISRKKEKKNFVGKNLRYVVFLLCVVIINLFYSVAYESMSFLVSTMYYIYNALVMYTFWQYMEDSSFLNKFATTLKIAMSIQLIVYICNMGRWYLGLRYMGTFNDPNQFAFFVFSIAILLVIIDLRSKQKINYLWIIIAFFLVSRSSSVGVFLGLCILCLGSILFSRNNKKAMVLNIVSIIFALMLMLVLVEHMPTFITSSDVYLRFMQKINKFGLNDSVDYYSGFGVLLEERGWHRIVEYPGKIIYGAGEGLLNRFGGNLEVHSSFLGLLFYYGIVPTVCLFSWILNKAKKIEKKYWFIYLAFFVEALFLNNTRQPFFWIILIIIELGKQEKKMNGMRRRRNEVKELIIYS